MSHRVVGRWGHRGQHAVLGTARHIRPACRRSVACPRAVGRTAFSVETSRLLKLVLTRQAVKTCLNYLSETNGELHYFLHQYLAENPLPLDPRVDPDMWLADLASMPLTKVNDPRRSSVVSAAVASAVLHGEREVSPRSVAERILALRAHIALEMQADMAGISLANTDVLRAAAQRATGNFRLPSPE